MALDEKDLQAIRGLMREEIKRELDPFKEQVDRRFDFVGGCISKLENE